MADTTPHRPLDSHRYKTKDSDPAVCSRKSFQICIASKDALQPTLSPHLQSCSKQSFSNSGYFVLYTILIIPIVHPLCSLYCTRSRSSPLFPLSHHQPAAEFNSWEMLPKDRQTNKKHFLLLNSIRITIFCGKVWHNVMNGWENFHWHCFIYVQHFFGLQEFGLSVGKMQKTQIFNFISDMSGCVLDCVVGQKEGSSSLWRRSGNRMWKWKWRTYVLIAFSTIKKS